jgi:hypothetical protein
MEKRIEKRMEERMEERPSAIFFKNSQKEKINYNKQIHPLAQGEQKKINLGLLHKVPSASMLPQNERVTITDMMRGTEMVHSIPTKSSFTEDRAEYRNSILRLEEKIDALNEMVYSLMNKVDQISRQSP